MYSSKSPKIIDSRIPNINRFMRHLRLLLTFMSACAVSFAMAFDITVDGIGYNIVDRTAHTVTVSGWDENYFTSSTNPSNPNIGTGSGDVSGPVNLVLPWSV